ncbi:hypothetical protein F441_05355 [Phytophthora nicotianae CJ01A1]|uniref:Uncharacterized protein n=2 Tax=Phytophthora nicotianae TaxID=4792 RepID=W2QH76_PHYN3|nr:hypothetical protein PPTG_22549 [Phytophthora nicotianae INRA-310]ETN11849.1 hypothetical protein PPTG_22549 [Phytophthora nicotianae INRA-310]ETP21048.1 hypothetical protein F441_05355 [Phytophthora nicotianae CJ01A1]
MRRDGHEHVLLAVQALDTVHPVRQNVLLVLSDEHVPTAPDLVRRRQHDRVTVDIHHTLVVVETHERLVRRLAPTQHLGTLVGVGSEHDVIALNPLSALENHSLAALLDLLNGGVVTNCAIVLFREEFEERLNVTRANVPPLVLRAVRTPSQRAENHLPQRDIQRVGMRLKTAKELRDRQVQHVVLGHSPEDGNEGQEVVAEELF